MCCVRGVGWQYCSREPSGIGGNGQEHAQVRSATIEEAAQARPDSRLSPCK